MEAPAFTAEIFSRVRHRVATLTMRADLVGWVQSGCKTMLRGHQRETWKAGQVFLVARGTQWDVINDPAPAAGYRTLVFSLTPEIVREFDERYGKDFATRTVEDCAHLELDPALQQSLEHAAKSAQDATAPLPLQRHRILEVLLLLAERGHAFRRADLVGWDDRVRRLIGQRPHEDWDARSVAAALHVSPSTLRRRLQESETTIGEVLREVRMESGLLLLQTTGLAVGEIAQHCGYTSHSRFSAAFRRRFGFPPSHLRQDAAMGNSAQSLELSG